MLTGGFAAHVVRAFPRKDQQLSLPGGMMHLEMNNQRGEDCWSFPFTIGKETGRTQWGHVVITCSCFPLNFCEPPPHSLPPRRTPVWGSQWPPTRLIFGSYILTVFISTPLFFLFVFWSLEHILSVPFLIWSPPSSFSENGLVYHPPPPPSWSVPFIRPPLLFFWFSPFPKLSSKTRPPLSLWTYGCETCRLGGWGFIHIFLRVVVVLILKIVEPNEDDVLCCSGTAEVPPKRSGTQERSAPPRPPSSFLLQFHLLPACPPSSFSVHLLSSPPLFPPLYRKKTMYFI